METKLSISRRDFLKVAAGGAALAGLGFPASSPKSPNLLFIFCDQLRACDLDFGPKSALPTPNLAKLAADGVVMRQCFSVSPVCSPYRGQLMTGRYPWHNGVERNGSALKEGQAFFADILKSAGYETGYIGKWHLSGLRSDMDYVPKDKRAGWEYWLGVNEGKKPDQAYYFKDEEKFVKVDIEGMEPDFQAERAIEFIERPREAPFALMISFNPPHGGKAPEAYNQFRNPALRPNVPKELESDARRKMGSYYALISWMDDVIGRIMAAVDRLTKDRETLIVFTADHGIMLNSQGCDRKIRPWEESARVPFVARLHGSIKPAKTCNAMFSSVDIMPTLLGLLGISIPAGLDGRDFSSAMRSGKVTSDMTLTYLSARGINPEGPGFDWRAVRTTEWLYAVHAKGDWLLYDLKNDPYELKNLSADPAFAETRDRLRASLETWRKKFEDTSELGVSKTLPAPGELHAEDGLSNHKNGGDGKGDKDSKKRNKGSGESGDQSK